MMCNIFCFFILFTVANCQGFKNGNVQKIANDGKTVYTLEQIELIICEHREASYLFKCNFEYAKIDLKSDLEENKRQAICKDKSLDPNKQCQALRNVGCNPYNGLKSWCIKRKAEIEEQRLLWHNIIAVTCHKNLVRHTEICKNGKNKMKEGDKHISHAQITQLMSRENDQKFKKPMVLASKSKPKIKPVIFKPTKVPRPEKSAIELPYPQILINYIFGESQSGIEIENLIFFIAHVFKEGENPLKPITPAVVSIGQGKEKEKLSHYLKPLLVSNIGNPENFPFLEHILVEGKPNIEKPILSVPFYNIKSKVNKRLAELLLDYIFGLNRPLDFEEELQQLIAHLFEEEQRFIDESKLRSILVDIIIGYKPLLHITKPITSQSIYYSERPKTNEKIAHSNKPHYSHSIEQIILNQLNLYKPSDSKPKPFGNLASLEKPYLLQNLQQFILNKINKTSVPITNKPLQVKPIKFEPAPIHYIPKDEFDVSFIFKIADELLTPMNHAYYSRNSDSSLNHYNFLIGEEKGQKKLEVAENELKVENNDNDLEEHKKSIIDRAQSSINDLMISMNLQ